MSDQDFLVWQDIAYQTEAHLLEHGQRLPVETRMILAGIRDVARERGELGRQAMLGAREQAARPARPAPVRARQDLMGRLRRVAAVAAVALIAVVLPSMPGGPDPERAPYPVLTGSDGGHMRSAEAPVVASEPRKVPAAVESPLAPNPLYAPAVEAALDLDVQDARLLQLALRKAGHKLAVDGIIGPETRSALAAWQSVNGEVPTGHFTPDAVDALKAAAAKIAPARASRSPRLHALPQMPLVREPACPTDDSGVGAYGFGPACDVKALGNRLSRLFDGSADASTVP